MMNVLDEELKRRGFIANWTSGDLLNSLCAISST
jgi:hypothetical protein